MTKTNAYGFFQIFLIFSKYVKKQTQMHMVSLKYFKYILISTVYKNPPNSVRMQ